MKYVCDTFQCATLHPPPLILPAFLLSWTAPSLIIHLIWEDVYQQEASHPTSFGISLLFGDRNQIHHGSNHANMHANACMHQISHTLWDVIKFTSLIADKFSGTGASP